MVGKTKRITQVDYIMKLGDGQDYNVNPLSLVETKNITSQLKGLDKIAPDTDLEEIPGLMDKLIKVCFTILIKSNPNITEVKVGNIVTVTDIKNILAVGLGGVVETEEETAI